MHGTITHTASGLAWNAHSGRGVVQTAFVFWCVLLAILLGIGPLEIFQTPFMTSDDAMRLVSVRDLLKGWHWFDFRQVRLDPPEGVVMHWSHLIDAPIAFIIMAFKVFMPTHVAELYALYVWPLLLLLGFLIISAFLALRFAGGGVLAGAILPVCYIPLLYEFRLGSLDHHNVQLMLTTLLVLTILNSFRRPLFAVISGAIAALMLAIGIETLAFIVAAIAAFGLRWIWDRSGSGDRLLRFALSFAAFTGIFFFLTTAPSRYAVAQCDALSPAYLLASLLTALGCILLVSGSCYLYRKLLRIPAAIGVGICALTIIGLVFPQCLQGPYAEVDPMVVSLWMNYITEAQGLLYTVQNMPKDIVLYYTMPFIGLCICLFCIWFRRGERLWDWIILLMFLALAFGIALIQVRGAKFAGALAIPVGAWLIVRATTYLKSQDHVARRLVGVIGSWLLFVGVFHLSIFESMAGIQLERNLNSSSSSSNKELYVCIGVKQMRHLNTLPPGLILAHSNLGAYILLETHHSVVAGNYHRNAKGLLDSIHAFNVPKDQGYELIKKQKVKYIVTCPTQKHFREDGKTAPDALAHALNDGKPPLWLKPIQSPEKDVLLKVYEVK
ncbi:MAG: hypothetical protein AAF228_09035 [Pseudomonadota bacterium]